jgi:NADPH:quinone reductase-like Zn-dependent oxidoreductase
MPANTAAWYPAKYAELEVGLAPYTAPGAHEIVVRNHAVAINPVDWAIPRMGGAVFGWIKPPTVLGSDVAGQVVEIGAGVSRFKIGDRVFGQALGTSKSRYAAAGGAFQDYTVLVDHMAAPIPDSMSYESAAVLPLAVSTAACGLFQEDHLALQHPSIPPKPTGKTLLVWGGSTSVGSNAIQLAVAAGYEVVSTASPRNFGYVRALGASRVFDYNSETVVRDIVAALNGKTIAGAIAIGTGSTAPCFDIVRACKGDKFVSTASSPISLDALPERGGLTPSMMFTFVSSGIAMAIKARMSGIRTKFIFGDTLADNEVGPMLYVDFLPKALALGSYLAAPEPLVVGHGLELIQPAFDAQIKGVSARKIVVTLGGMRP